MNTPEQTPTKPTYNRYIVTVNGCAIRTDQPSAKAALLSVLRSKDCPDICPMVDGEAASITVKIVPPVNERTDKQIAASIYDKLNRRNHGYGAKHESAEAVAAKLNIPYEQAMDLVCEVMLEA